MPAYLSGRERRTRTVWLPCAEAPAGRKTPEALLERQNTDPHSLVLGVDEAGRGCLAGPVVAAAVLFTPHIERLPALAGLDDSKKLKPGQRAALAPAVRAHALAWGVGLAWPREIDRVNILQATFRAMSRAVLVLERRWTTNCPLPCLLVDGNHQLSAAAWESCAKVAPSLWHVNSFPPLPQARFRATCSRPAPDRPTCASTAPCPSLPEQRAIIRGDSLVPAIAAASVLAKTFRDRLMETLDRLVPGYGFALHKGYGTAAHLEALAALGPSCLHRLTFRKVRPDPLLPLL